MTHPAWRGQLTLLGLLALVGTLPFWLSDLDIVAAAWFYDPTAADPWHTAQEPLWTLLYQLSPLLAALLLLGGLGTALAAGRLPRLAPWRRHALFVVALVALGPGLLVNGLLKDHWGRPRPHQLAAFGYAKPYLPPLAMGESGKSFPCGHSSVGFAFYAFFLIWRRRRPWLAAGALAGTLVIGTLLGVGRMVAGDHFLSDVLWSAVVTFGTAIVLYYFVLRIPEHEAAAQSRPPVAAAPTWVTGIYLAAAAVAVGGVLLATPVAQQETLGVPTIAAGGPRLLRIETDAGNLLLSWSPPRTDGYAALLRVKARGFGLPGTRLTHARNGSTLVFRHAGVYTERDTQLAIGVVGSAWDRIELITGEGDIRVQETNQPIPALELSAPRGEVTGAPGRAPPSAGMARPP